MWVCVCSVANRVSRPQAELNEPSRFKARVTELESHQRMHEAVTAPRGSLQLSGRDRAQLYDVLKSQGEGLSKVTKLVRRDARDVKIVADSTAQWRGR